MSKPCIEQLKTVCVPCVKSIESYIKDNTQSFVNRFDLDLDVPIEYLEDICISDDCIVFIFAHRANRIVFYISIDRFEKWVNQVNDT